MLKIYWKRPHFAIVSIVIQKLLLNSVNYDKSMYLQANINAGIPSGKNSRTEIAASIPCVGGAGWYFLRTLI